MPPAPQATGPVAALTETEIPQMDPMTGMPMPAPRLARQSPGLPVRPETQAPLNTPPSGWPDLPVTAPRFGVPLAVPDPNVRGAGFPAPPGPTAMDRIKAAAARGFGDESLGFSAENRAKYPHTYLRWQPYAAPLDFALRAPGAAIGAISSAGSEIYQALGGNALKGRAFEEEGLGNLNATDAAIRTQVSARPYVDASRTLAGYGVRLDAMSINEKGALELTDFKSSESAGYTRNQKKGYPLFERYGGQVVGKSGDEHYPHGFQIQPTKVTTIRPSDFKVEK